MGRAVQFGGQAVIEGVMMRGQGNMAIAVRRFDKTITVKRERVTSVIQRWPLLGWPFLRGVVMLYEALSLGIKALMFSANEAASEEEEEITPAEMALTVVVSFGLAILFFVIAPTVGTGPLERMNLSDLALNTVEGIIRLGVLLGYIYVISRMDDVRRVFQYHGAEHKVIHAYEKTGDLNVETARAQPRFHPRCGTTFLVYVAVLSIFLYAFFGWPGFWERLFVRVATLPIVAALAYELIKISARLEGTSLEPLLLPGMWLQGLTTQEPDDDQLEVAVEALRAALNNDPSSVELTPL